MKMFEAMLVLMFFGIQDFKKHRLSTKCLGFAFALAVGLAGIRGGLFLEGVAGLLPGAALLLASKLTQGQIGDGDAFVLMITGILLGIGRNLELFFLGLLLVSVYAGYLIVIKHYKKKHEIAFIPFLAAAQVILILLDIFRKMAIGDKGIS